MVFHLTFQSLLAKGDSCGISGRMVQFNHFGSTIGHRMQAIANFDSAQKDDIVSQREYFYQELVFNEAEAEAPGNDQESVIDAVVSAHYLALQLRMLVENSSLANSEAAKFMAAALTDWANLASDDIFDQDIMPPIPICGKH